MISLLDKLNNNKLLIGLSMVLFNIGSKYIMIDVSKGQDHFLKTKVARRITLFCIFFVATRDVTISFLMTVLFVVVVFNIFHEESRFNLVPKSFYDNEYTAEEYDMAKKIVGAFESKKDTPNVSESKEQRFPEGIVEYSLHPNEKSFGSKLERSDFEEAFKPKKKHVSL